MCYKFELQIVCQKKILIICESYEYSKVNFKDANKVKVKELELIV